MNYFSNVLSMVEMIKRVNFDEKTLIVKDNFVRKDIYGITLMLVSQNFSI